MTKHKFSKKYIKSTVREIESKKERGHALIQQGDELKAHAANLEKMLKDSGVSQGEFDEARQSLIESDAKRHASEPKKKAA